MLNKLRLLPLLVALTLVLGMALPVVGQDLLAVSTDCAAEGYTGQFASIEAVDELTVKFTLCYPDPAFPSKVAFAAFAIQSSEYLEQTGGGGDLVQSQSEPAPTNSPTGTLAASWSSPALMITGEPPQLNRL